MWYLLTFFFQTAGFYNLLFLSLKLFTFSHVCQTKFSSGVSKLKSQRKLKNKHKEHFIFTNRERCRTRLNSNLKSIIFLKVTTVKPGLYESELYHVSFDPLRIF